MMTSTIVAVDSFIPRRKLEPCRYRLPTLTLEKIILRIQQHEVFSLKTMKLANGNIIQVEPSFPSIHNRDRAIFSDATASEKG